MINSVIACLFLFVFGAVLFVVNATAPSISSDFPKVARIRGGDPWPCWRRPSCEALFLRQATPTCSGFSCIAGGRVGAGLPVKPYFFAGPRQHAPVFPGRSPPMLAPAFLQSLSSSPGHANTVRFFPGGRRPCWRLPPCEALFLRRVTPTCSGFFRAVAGHVGAFLPAKPYFFAGSRQHAPVFPV